MNTNQLTSNHRTTHTRTGNGPHHLMLGNVVVSRLLGGDRTDGALSLLEVVGPCGSGPGPHVDPWCESFYVLDGELTFRLAENGGVRTLAARSGDAVSIPQGVGHAFSVTSATPACYLIASTPAGIDAFFADAGEDMPRAVVPREPAPFDRERLRAAFDKHRLMPFTFAGDSAASTTCVG